MNAMRALFVMGCLVTASCATTKSTPAMTAAPTPTTDGLAAEEREWLRLAPDGVVSRHQSREVTREQRRNTGTNLVNPSGANLVTKG